jgi:enoyl-[acyl-carrier-protein] reductase (NADH)
MAELIERADDPAQQRVEFEMRQPTNKMVDAREVSLAVTWLANPINRSITGSVIEIDGGMGTIRLHRGRTNHNPINASDAD